MSPDLPLSPSPRRRLARAGRAVRLAVLRRRRWLAAGCAAVAVAAGLATVATPPPPTVEVLVAATDLPAGHTLTEADLVATAFLPGSVPDGVASTPVGRLLAAPLPRGQPVTDVALVGPSMTAGADDVVAVPVRLPDGGSVGLLATGDRIDLLAADPQGGAAVTVADDVTVLAVPATAATSGTSDPLPGRLLVVGASPEDVVDIADATARLLVSYAWAMP